MPIPKQETWQKFPALHSIFVTLRGEGALLTHPHSLPAHPFSHGDPMHSGFLHEFLSC
jgi:hypothetical protein